MIEIDDCDAGKAKDQIAHGGRYGAKRVMEAESRNNIGVFRIPPSEIAQG